MSKNINYDHAEHLHRFACWTAAAAVRRAFVGNEVIAQVIEDINLKQELFEFKNVEPSAEKFDEKHKEYSKRLVTRLKELLNSQAEKDKVTYGRAAKIIAIYIKTCYVIPDPECALSRVAHPPIDRILLTNLAKCKKIEKTEIITWTQVEQKDYFILIDRLRNLEPDHFWKLERYWQSH
jgi:hypothetical protein